jgi:hypothetical protein
MGDAKYILLKDGEKNNAFEECRLLGCGAVWIQ